jgi:hypothetical protein
MKSTINQMDREDLYGNRKRRIMSFITAVALATQEMDIRNRRKNFMGIRRGQEGIIHPASGNEADDKLALLIAKTPDFTRSRQVVTDNEGVAKESQSKSQSARNIHSKLDTSEDLLDGVGRLK